MEKNEIEARIRRLIETNNWLNGVYEIMEGDMCPEDYYENAKPIKARSIKQLYNMWRKWDNGVFMFRNIVLIKHWNFGTFVYDMRKAEDGEKDYFEHLDTDISFKSFCSAIREKLA